MTLFHLNNTSRCDDVITMLYFKDFMLIKSYRFWYIYIEWLTFFKELSFFGIFAMNGIHFTAL